MPKIIENVRETLLAEAKRQISERGYGSTTIRSVAAECGIAVGTVYNYFDSKDMLIASFMLDDWLLSTDLIRNAPTADPREYLLAVYSALCTFSGKYSALFSDKEAAKAYNSAFGERHKQLRAQLAELMRPICRELDNADFACEFIAESMLSWTMAGKDFDSIYDIIKKIII